MFKPYLIPAAAQSSEIQSSLGSTAYALPRPAISTERLIVLASLFFTVFCNQSFWRSILEHQGAEHAATWLFCSALFIVVTAMHCLLLGLVVHRRTAKPILAALFLMTAGVVHYMQDYKVFFDPGMLRNVLHTDIKEARELLSFSLLRDLALLGILPTMLMMRLHITERPWRVAVIARAALLIGSFALVLAGLGLQFQNASALLRNHKEIRYLVTPGNYLTSAVGVLLADNAGKHAARLPVGEDARLGSSWTGRRKPALLVVVVGETARAANWGLNGYARQTTPELAGLGVLNFPHVTSCGSNTEVSVPCMFSPFGRKDYDEKKIHRHESLLHVLERGGIKTLWRDNQSGCKGVCDGLESQQLDQARDPALCNGERCLDEILIDGLEAELDRNKGNLVIVLHQLGNHGPAYSQRYPDAFRQFTPTCDTADLGKCSREQIVNSYDNALLYTDHFLAQAIARLKAQTSHDAALVYVSDHGESLGENGFYLHGLPYAIAPREQTGVPMVAWFSPGFSSSFGIDADCLKRNADAPISHDYLFHSVLGMLAVDTTVYDKAYDFTAKCRN